MGRGGEGSERRVVLVCGAGRSGTSTLAGLLKVLGLVVPGREVPADESNPRGFSESQWVVDLHDRMLAHRLVQVADARPGAWEQTADVPAERVEQVAARLGEQMRAAGPDADLVVKDPRLSWFLGLWRDAAALAGITPVFATMLRPPAEVAGSRETHYGADAGAPHLVATWLNMQLFTELSTRDAGPRAFVRYADLLTDAEPTVRALGERLGLGSVERADADAWARARGFVDPTLRRQSRTLDDLELPGPLRELTAAVWHEFDLLAAPDGDTPEARGRLDGLRADYVRLYREAASLATSSAVAARARGRREGQTAATAATAGAGGIRSRLKRVVGR